MARRSGACLQIALGYQISCICLQSGLMYRIYDSPAGLNPSSLATSPKVVADFSALRCDIQRGIR